MRRRAPLFVHTRTARRGRRVSAGAAGSAPTLAVGKNRDEKRETTRGSDAAKGGGGRSERSASEQHGADRPQSTWAPFCMLGCSNDVRLQSTGAAVAMVYYPSKLGSRGDAPAGGRTQKTSRGSYGVRASSSAGAPRPPPLEPAGLRSKRTRQQRTTLNAPASLAAEHERASASITTANRSSVTSALTGPPACRWFFGTSDIFNEPRRWRRGPPGGMEAISLGERARLDAMDGVRQIASRVACSSPASLGC